MAMELAREHDALREAMSDFAQFMAHDGGNDMAAVARRRIRFSQLFREHMAQEDAMVQALPHALLTPRAAQIVREHRQALLALFLRYSDHIKYWTPAQIALDWPGYRGAVLTLQDGLYERMAWEERHLHPLFEGSLRQAA